MKNFNVNHKILKNEKFTDGVRVLFLIHRSKEGGSANNDKLEKVITRNTEEFLEAFDRLYMLQYASERPLRIYSAVNPRNFDKAIRKFKESMLDSDYDRKDIQHRFYLDIENRFISALMKPSSRESTTFLFDVDDKNIFGKVHNDLLAVYSHYQVASGIKEFYQTKNGYHILTEPFNPALFPLNYDGKVSLNKDGLVLLSYEDEHDNLLHSSDLSK